MIVLPSDYNDVIIKEQEIKLKEIMKNIERLSNNDVNRGKLKEIFDNINLLIESISKLSEKNKVMKEYKIKYEGYKNKYIHEIELFEEHIIKMIEELDTKFNEHFNIINTKAVDTINEMNKKINGSTSDIDDRIFSELLKETEENNKYSAFIENYNKEYDENSELNIEKSNIKTKIEKLYKISEDIKNKIDKIGEDYKIIFDKNKIELNKLLPNIGGKNNELEEIFFFIKSFENDENMNKTENISNYINFIHNELTLSLKKKIGDLPETYIGKIEYIIILIKYFLNINIRQNEKKTYFDSENNYKPKNYKKYFSIDNKYNLEKTLYFNFDYNPKNEKPKKMIDIDSENYKSKIIFLENIYNSNDQKINIDIKLKDLKYKEIKVIQNFTYNLLIIFDKYDEYFKELKKYI
jgi:hypothetical protein